MKYSNFDRSDPLETPSGDVAFDHTKPDVERFTYGGLKFAHVGVEVDRLTKLHLRAHKLSNYGEALLAVLAANPVLAIQYAKS